MLKKLTGGSKKVEEESGGDVNDAGLLASFERQGFTPAKRLLELVANSIDAIYAVIANISNYPGKILFDIQKDYIKIIDNGIGMTNENSKKMWSVFRENNSSNKSRGVSGLGSKPALEGLSNRTEVKIFTRTADGEYRCIIIPWDKMYEQLTYTGMIKFRHMTYDEQHTFIAERSDKNNLMIHNSVVQGTTICIKRNSVLEDLIDDNFTDIMKSNLTNPLDRIDCIFGKENNIIEFCYKKYGKKDVDSLLLYDYFGQENNKYYTGVNTEYVEEYYKKGDNPRFIYTSSLDGKKYEINIHSRKGNVPQYKKKAELALSTSGWTLVGRYAVTTALLKCDSIFDEDNPIAISAAKRIDGYSKEFIGDTNNKEGWKYISKLKIVRNNQLIGYCDIPDKDEGSSRGTGRSMFDTLIQTEISFDPVSTHANIQDKTIGIQQNKNQFDGKAVPINLLRLVKHIRNIKADEVWEYFEYILEGNASTISDNNTVDDSCDETPVTPVTAPVAPNKLSIKKPKKTKVEPAKEHMTTISEKTDENNSVEYNTPIVSNPIIVNPTVQQNKSFITENYISTIISPSEEYVPTEGHLDIVSDLDSIISEETPVNTTPKNAVFASVLLEKIDPFNYYTKQQLLDIINSIEFPSI